MPEAIQDIGEFAEKLIEHAIIAFGDGVPVSEEERRRNLLNYNVGIVRFIEGVGILALKTNQHLTSPGKRPEDKMREALNGLREPTGPYAGHLQIGEFVRLTWALGPKLKGTLARVEAIKQNSVNGWSITVRRIDGKRWDYPYMKTEPMVENYRGYEIVWRCRKDDVYLFAYDAEGLAALPYQRYHSLEVIRAEIDKLVNA